jgi:uncharacterized FAD-dependent dehydrogenase
MMTMKKNSYDIIVIGCGTAGIFAGYELNKLCPGLDILMLEQGKDIYHRSCPIVSKKTKSCINCASCGIMNGFGGAGAFSDGKYNFTTQFGGWLSDYLDSEYIMDLIEYVDSVNVEFGATLQRFSTNSPEAREIARKALSHDLHLLEASVKHLGTENNKEILSRMYDYLTAHVEIACNSPVSPLRSLRTATGSQCLTVPRPFANISLQHREDQAPNGFPPNAESWIFSLSTIRWISVCV